MLDEPKVKVYGANMELTRRGLVLSQLELMFPQRAAG